MKHFEQIADTCHYLLRNFPGADEFRSYLDARLNEESQKKFKVGYFPGSKYIDILTREVGEDVLLDLQLLYKYDIADSLFPRQVNVCYFEHHPLIIPYRNVQGDIIAFIGRTLLPEDKRKELKLIKYKNTVFKKGHHLFGLYEAKHSILESDAVYVVEGQFDVIKAHEVGFTNVVALGNSQMTPYQFSLLSRYTKNINLLLDNDEAGDKGRKSAKDKFGRFANIKDWYVPDPYKDLDECIKENQVRPILRIKKWQ